MIFEQRHPDIFNDNLRIINPNISKGLEAAKDKSYLVFYPQRTLKHLEEFYALAVKLHPTLKTEIDTEKCYPLELPMMEYHKQRIEELLLKLIHAQIIINYTHRERINGVYQSDRDDYINALAMVKPLAELYSKHRNNVELELVALIYYHFKHNEPFTQKQLAKALNYSKTHAYRIVNLLLERQLIIKVGGFKNKGFLYTLIK